MADGRPPVELTMDQRQIVDAVRALRGEEDGKALRKELIENIRRETTPLVADLKSAVLAVPSEGGPRDGAPLRQTIAQAIKPQVRLSGQNAGVSVRARGIRTRGFRLAARAFNRPNWRHPVFGRDVWVTQTAQPQWFDRTAKGRTAAMRAAVLKAVEDMSRRVAARANGR